MGEWQVLLAQAPMTVFMHIIALRSIFSAGGTL
jgi:hypothetical protein